MSRSYPIWHEVTACNYNSGKSYGSRDTGATTVKIGTSGSNSHELVHHFTTRREIGDFIVFRFGYQTPEMKEPQVLVTRYMVAKTREMMPEGFKPAAQEIAA